VLVEEPICIQTFTVEGISLLLSPC
jgi:hypothetical protein